MCDLITLSLHTSVYPRFTRLLQVPVPTSLVRERQKCVRNSDQMVLEWIRIICLLLCWQRDACEYLWRWGDGGEKIGRD